MVGWFARLKSGDVVLVANRGQKWPIRFVSILQGGWGAIDNSEGVTKLPRVREYDSEGNVTIEGDRVIIDFINGDKRRPLVRGGVRSLTASDFFPYNQTSGKANPNRLAMRLAPLDDEGKATGYVDVEVGGDDRATVKISVTPAQNSPKDGPPPGARSFVTIDPGDENGGAAIQIAVSTGETLLVKDGQVAFITPDGHMVSLTPDGGLQLAQGDGNGGAESWLNMTGGVVQAGSTSGVELLSKSITMGNGILPSNDAYILSGDFFIDLNLALLDIVAGLALVPYVATNAAAMQVKVATSIAAGPPYLSTIIKGQ